MAERVSDGRGTHDAAHDRVVEGGWVPVRARQRKLRLRLLSRVHLTARRYRAIWTHDFNKNRPVTLACSLPLVLCEEPLLQ